MSTGKKYSYQLTQSSSSWNASIIRHISSRKNTLSKKQCGFKTESEAKQWAEAELEKFVLAQKQRNERKNKKRELKQAQHQERSVRKTAKTTAVNVQKNDDKKSSTMNIWNKKSPKQEKELINDKSLISSNMTTKS